MEIHDLNVASNSTNPDMIANALTVDVEDYFQVHAFSHAIRMEEWDALQSRVEKNTRRILDLLDSCSPPRATDQAIGEKPRATFFVLGWIAERYPELVGEIQRRGHEVACHGYGHKVISNQTREEFAEDVKRSKEILEDLSGNAVIGYRAPTYSVRKKTLWALEVLIELGFRYDSSIFPIKHDVYGFPEAHRFPHIISFEMGKGDAAYSSQMTTEDSHSSHHRPNSLAEFPMTTARILGYNFPVAGGGYFRLLPYSLNRYLLRRVNTRESKPFIFYIHPWEIDPGIPKIDGVGILSRFRTCVNLDKTEDRFARLLSEFRFCPLSDFLD